MRRIKRSVSIGIIATSILLGNSISSPAAESPSNTTTVPFSKVGYKNHDTFDFMLESLLSSKRERIAILTTNAYDGVTIPELDGRLQSWLQLWLEANRNKKDALSLLGKLPSGSFGVGASSMGGMGIIEIVFNLAGFDPHKTTDTILTTVERWAKEGSRSVLQYAKETSVKKRRKSALGAYLVAFCSIDGKAVIIFSTEPVKLTSEKD